MFQILLSILLSLLTVNAFYQVGRFFLGFFFREKPENGSIESIVWGLMIAIALQFTLLHFFTFPNPFVYYFWHGVVSFINLLCATHVIRERHKIIQRFNKQLPERYMDWLYRLLFIFAGAFFFFLHTGGLAFEGAGVMGWLGDYFDYGNRYAEVMMGIFLPAYHVGFEIYSSIFQSYFDNYTPHYKLTFVASTITMGVVFFYTLKQFFLTLDFDEAKSHLLSFLAYLWGPIIAFTYPKFYTAWIGFFFPGFQASYWNPTFVLSSIFLIFFVIYFIRKAFFRSALFLSFSFFLKPSGFFGLAPFVFPYLLFTGLKKRSIARIGGALTMLIPPLYYAVALKSQQAVSLLSMGGTMGGGGSNINFLGTWLGRMDNTLLNIFSLQQAVILVFLLSFAGLFMTLLLKWKNRKPETRWDTLYILLFLTFLWGMAGFFLLQQNAHPIAPNYKWVQAHASSLLIPFLFYEIASFYQNMKKKESVGRILLFSATLIVVGLHLFSGLFHIIVISAGGLNT